MGACTPAGNAALRILTERWRRAGQPDAVWEFHGARLAAPGIAVMVGDLLVDAGRCFACSHRHGEGDRCLSFRFEPELFECIAHDAGRRAGFTHNRLPPLRSIRAVWARPKPGARTRKFAAARRAWRPPGRAGGFLDRARRRR